MNRIVAGFIGGLGLIIAAGGVYYMVNTQLEQDRVDRFDKLMSVDGLTLSEQNELAKKAGNDRYYSNAEVDAFLVANGKKPVFNKQERSGH